MDFLGQFFEKFSNIKFYENLSIGSRVVPCGQTEGQKYRHNESNSRFFPILRRQHKYLPHNGLLSVNIKSTAA